MLQLHTYTFVALTINVLVALVGAVPLSNNEMVRVPPTPFVVILSIPDTNALLPMIVGAPVTRAPALADPE